MVNLDGGKIVTVQKAKKDGEKSTKVTLVMMMTTTLMMMMMDIPILPFQHSLFLPINLIRNSFLESNKTKTD